MNTLNVIKEFIAYARYDPGRRNFILGSNEHKLHTICQKINSFLEFYPTGVLAVIYLRKSYEEFLSNLQLDVVKLFKNPKALEEEKSLWDGLNTSEMLAIENGLAETINKIVVKINGSRFIGQRNIDKEIEVLEKSLEGAIGDIKGCNKEIYIQGGDLQPITNFSNRITVFKNLTDCLLALEHNAPDGMYLCYIDYNKSADGYFGFFIKNNGNIFSINDRVIESFPGAHDISRNARWVEDKKSNLFPYDYIFNYDNHDYKGYATKFDIQSDMLDFFNLSPEVYMPLVISMSLLSQRYSEGQLEDFSQVYCNTMLECNLPVLRASESQYLAVVETSAISTLTRRLDIKMDADKVKSGECVKDFKKADEWFENGQFPDENSMFVEMYGDGFDFNIASALSTSTEIIPYGSITNTRPEFTTTEDHLKVIAYKQGRQQLAEYIRDQMCEELKRFGGVRAIDTWFNEVIRKKQDIFFDMFVRKYLGITIEGEYASLAPRIHISEADNYADGYLPFNEKIGMGYSKTTCCPVNGKTPNIEIRFVPESWLDLELMFGDIPKIIKGWVWQNTSRGYGNPLISITDAVTFVGTPFEYSEHRRNKRLWQEQDWQNEIWRVSHSDQDVIKKEKQMYDNFEHSRVMNFGFGIKFSRSGIKEYARKNGIKIPK